MSKIKLDMFNFFSNCFCSFDLIILDFSSNCSSLMSIAIHTVIWCGDCSWHFELSFGPRVGSDLVVVFNFAVCQSGVISLYCRKWFNGNLHYNITFWTEESSFWAVLIKFHLPTQGMNSTHLNLFTPNSVQNLLSRLDTFSINLTMAHDFEVQDFNQVFEGAKGQTSNVCVAVEEVCIPCGMAVCHMDYKPVVCDTVRPIQTWKTGS